MKKHASIKAQHEAVLREQQELREAVKALPLEQQQKLTATIGQDPDLPRWKQDMAEVNGKIKEWAKHATKSPEAHEEAVENVASWIEYADKIQSGINDRVRLHMENLNKTQAAVPKTIKYKGATYVQAVTSERAYNMLEDIFKKVDGLEMEAYKAWEAAKQDGDSDYEARAEMVRLALHLVEGLLASDHSVVLPDAKRLSALAAQFYSPEKA